MSKSNIIIKSTEVISDTLTIDHDFGSGYSLKIIEINPEKEEKVLLEMESAPDRFVNLKAIITDNQII